MWSCLPPTKRWILSLPWNLIGSYVWCWQTEWSRQDIVWPLGLAASTFTPLKPWVMMYRSPTLPGETMWIERPPPRPELLQSLRWSTIWLRPSWIMLPPAQLSLQRMSTAGVTTGETRRTTHYTLQNQEKINGSCAADIMDMVPSMCLVYMSTMGKKIFVMSRH